MCKRSSISGHRYLTFNGLVKACAIAAGKSVDAVKLVHYDAKQFNFGKRKGFPLREQHFFASIHKAIADLNWHPEFDLISGLKASCQTDYLVSGRDRAEIDFCLDDEILAVVGS